LNQTRPELNSDYSDRLLEEPVVGQGHGRFTNGAMME